MAEREKHIKIRLCITVIVLINLAFSSYFSFSQNKDSSTITLDSVKITDHRNPGGYKTNIPVQTLSSSILNKISSLSAGDAVRYFSGVLVKDYGGVGGLKTISVRSLGASNTGIIYDGIPVTDIQTGQIDLSRFNILFIQSINLFQANPTDLLSPASSYALPSVLAINTNTFKPVNFSKNQWQTGIKTGSFGLWQPYAGIYSPIKNNIVISAQVEATFSKGDYPYRVDNGNFSERLRRTNSEVNSFQSEANILKMFKDSSLLQLKIRNYNSERELPGSVIFFNARSKQKLWNKDIFIQSRYQKDLNGKTSFLLSGKYSHSYTRYIDPDFQNGVGGLDDRYNQDEFYLSAAVRTQLARNLTSAIATDASWNRLSANTNNFVEPVRFGLWNSFALKYSSGPVRLTGSILNTYFSDETRLTSTKIKHNKLIPTASVSLIPKGNSPFLFRFFFKSAYRMPTFNDLYYTFIGNRNLSPEISYQYNFGITWSKNDLGKLTKINVSADGYLNKIKDKIVAVPNQNLFNWTMYNLGKVNIKGIDINAETNINVTPEMNWFTRVSYTFQHAVDITDPTMVTYKNRIPYTPDNSGSLLTYLSYKNWTVSYSLLFSGKRYSMRANDPTNRLSGWAIQDITIIRKLKFHSIEMDVKAGLNNIFNSRYDVVRYFPMPGQNYLFTLNFSNL